MTKREYHIRHELAHRAASRTGNCTINHKQERFVFTSRFVYAKIRGRDEPCQASQPEIVASIPPNQTKPNLQEQRNERNHANRAGHPACAMGNAPAQPCSARATRRNCRRRQISVQRPGERAANADADHRCAPEPFHHHRRADRDAGALRALPTSSTTRRA